MIVSGGRNVYPAEVEAALDEHPAVRSSSSTRACIPTGPGAISPRSISAPHNGNVSNGWMYSPNEFLGGPMDSRYARASRRTSR